MTDNEMIETMRRVLKPKGTLPVVGLFFNGPGGAQYFSEEFVTSAIDALSKATMLERVGIEEMSPLEKLAAIVLMESAYIK